MVRQASLMSKLAQLALPDSIYYWAVDFNWPAVIAAVVAFDNHK